MQYRARPLSRVRYLSSVDRASVMSSHASVMQFRARPLSRVRYLSSSKPQAPPLPLDRCTVAGCTRARDDDRYKKLFAGARPLQEEGRRNIVCLAGKRPPKAFHDLLKFRLAVVGQGQAHEYLTRERSSCPVVEE